MNCSCTQTTDHRARTALHRPPGAGATDIGLGSGSAWRSPGPSASASRSPVKTAPDARLIHDRSWDRQRRALDSVLVQWKIAPLLWNEPPPSLQPGAGTAGNAARRMHVHRAVAQREKPYPSGSMRACARRRGEQIPRWFATSQPVIAAPIRASRARVRGKLVGNVGERRR